MRKNVRLYWLLLPLLWLCLGSWNVNYAQLSQINNNGGFESQLPSYWTIGNMPSGTTLSWATDQFRSMGHSLKIVKPATTSDSAAWVSTNMCDLWSQRHYANVDILLGAWIKTSGVNVNPTTDDQKWYVSYSFYDSAGGLIGTTKLPIDQSVATSTGWLADTSAIGQVILPQDSWKTIVALVAGKNATGTVWGDDFILTGRNGWAGQDWNTSVGVPTFMNYWLPPNGGNDGLLNCGYENTVVTTEEAHSGTHSLKFVLPITRTPHDAWVGTLRYPLDPSVKANSILRVSVWVKASGLYPDSARAFPGTWAIGLTPIFHSGYLPNDGYDQIGPTPDYVFTLPDTAHSFDWTQYWVDITVPNDVLAKNISARVHPYSRMVGTIYFDDLEVKLVGTTGVKEPGNIVPAGFYVYQNYPNPFNPSTVIRYNIPQTANVSVKIYNMLGQEIKTLFVGSQNLGAHSVIWNGDTNFGTKAASGTYIFMVKYNSQFQVKKMILLK